ncbi:MAG: type II toxin-antitoxin system VapC family toxin [Acidobacteria bacterium]|nr:type II toxin-antitoxin system VapC family toxin [Acidobacteriota bacterium]
MTRRRCARSSSGNSSTLFPVNGDSVALDTSAAIAVLADQASNLTPEPFKEILLPVPAIGELRYGAMNSRRAAENLAEVERLVARCRVLDITVTTAEVYARLRLQLKQQGQANSRERSLDCRTVRGA